MAGAAPPPAPCVVTAPTPSFEEVVALLSSYQNEIQRLQSANERLRERLAEYEAGVATVHAAMAGALRASQLESALHRVVATERGRRLVRSALHPDKHTGESEEIHECAHTVRVLLDL